MAIPLPDPSLTLVYRLDAVLGEPLELGEVNQGRRRIVPQLGGTFEGPDMKGKLLPGVSADWQILLPDGTALGDIRYTVADGRRGPAVRAITRRAPRQPRGSRASRPWRGCRCERVHLSHLYADRDCVPGARLAEQGCLHQRRRPQRRRRGLRDVPGRMTSPS